MYAVIEPSDKNTYEIELDQYRKAIIGDKDSGDFKPTLELPCWGECSLTLSIPTAEKILPTVQDDKILWTGKDYGAEFYQATDGFKFNIILPKKPSTNVFPLDFQSDNLKFYYQPPLTEEFKEGWSDIWKADIKVTETEVTIISGELAGKVVVSRPESVVGSYAVFHTTKGGLVDSKGKNYKTGKAFHWYRPLIYDNVGNKTWGILSVEPKAGLRTVTIPQTFLDNAVYPVTIDDDFGYSGSAATKSTVVDDRIYTWGTSTYSPASDGTANTMSIRCEDAAEGIICAIYDVSDDSLDGQTVAGACPAAIDWETMNISGSVSVYSAKSYRLAWNGDGATYNVGYDSGAAAPLYKYETNNYSPTPFTNPVSWSDSAAGNEWIFGIYCTYTPSAAGLDIAIAMHHYKMMAEA